MSTKEDLEKIRHNSKRIIDLCSEIASIIHTKHDYLFDEGKNRLYFNMIINNLKDKLRKLQAEMKMSWLYLSRVVKVDSIKDEFFPSYQHSYTLVTRNFTGHDAVIRTMLENKKFDGISEEMDFLITFYKQLHNLASVAERKVA